MIVRCINVHIVVIIIIIFLLLELSSVVLMLDFKT